MIKLLNIINNGCVVSPDTIRMFSFEINETIKAFDYNKWMIDFNCEICKKTLTLENIIVAENYGCVCKECAKKFLFNCHKCGKYINKDCLIHVEDKNIDVCHSCANMMNVRRCVDCGDSVCRWNSVEFVGRVCRKCFEKRECFECCSCERYYAKERYGTEGICITCANNRVENCHNYTYKPLPRFNVINDESTNLFFGVEVEMGNAKSYRDVMGFISEHISNSKMFYAKRDASIPAYGCEIVTHPSTLSYHKSELSNWKDMLMGAKKYGLHADNLDKCGVHVHMSRAALTNSQCAMMDYFVNNHKDFWKQIARRESHYSAYIQKTNDLWGRQISDRHCALNLSNEYTVELRIFKGTIDIGNIYAYLEACHAMINFIYTYHSLKSFENDGELINKFVEYFNSNPEYCNLQKYFEKNCKIA